MVFRILDSSAFYSGLPFTSDVTSYTTPHILDEVKHIKGKFGAIDLLIDTGRLKIIEPDAIDIQEIKKMALDTNDINELSNQDITILALCKNLNGELVTDDFALSNVAKNIGITVQPIMTTGIKHVGKWLYYCPQCHKNFKGIIKCRICNRLLKKKLLKR